MPQMAATIGTGDFCAHAIGVERALHRTSDFIIKTRPAAMCIKLIFRPIQRRVALSADKHACPVFVQQIASKWQLGAFVEDDAFFFIGESIHTSSIPLTQVKGEKHPSNSALYYTHGSQKIPQTGKAHRTTRRVCYCCGWSRGGGSILHPSRGFFRRDGYRTESTPRTGDYGVDLIAIKDGRRIAVQCKRYKDSIGQEAIREVYAGMQQYSCTVGVVVTNSHFTKHATTVAATTQCILIDREDLGLIASKTRAMSDHIVRAV